MIMTPALGFFYGGLVRRKNLVSTIAQCLAIFAVVSLVWALWGYTLALGPSFHGFIGDFSNFGLNNVGAAANPGYSAAPTLFRPKFEKSPMKPWNEGPNASVYPHKAHTRLTTAKIAR